MKKYCKTAAVLVCILILLANHLSGNQYQINELNSGSPLRPVMLKSLVDLFLLPQWNKQNSVLRPAANFAVNKKETFRFESQTGQANLKIYSRNEVINNCIALFFNFYQISRTCSDNDPLTGAYCKDNLIRR